MIHQPACKAFSSLRTAAAATTLADRLHRLRAAVDRFSNVVGALALAVVLLVVLLVVLGAVLTMLLGSVVGGSGRGVVRSRRMVVGRGRGRSMVSIAGVMSRGSLARHRVMVGIAAHQQIVAALDHRCDGRVGVDDGRSRHDSSMVGVSTAVLGGSRNGHPNHGQQSDRNEAVHPVRRWLILRVMGHYCTEEGKACQLTDALTTESAVILYHSDIGQTLRGSEKPR